MTTNKTVYMREYMQKYNTKGETYHCETCGKDVAKTSKYRHRKTKYHLKRLKCVECRGFGINKQMNDCKCGKYGDKREELLKMWEMY